MSARASSKTNRSPLSWVTLAAVALIAPAVLGCEIPLAMLIADDIDDSNDAYYGGYYGSSEAALQTKNGVLRGDIGDVTNFSASTSYIDAYAYEDWTTITLWADGSDSSTGQWAAMAAIDIQGAALGTDIFKPGAQLHFTSGQDIDGVYVSGWACSGQGFNASALEYEVSGSETDIEVTESEEPGMVHLAITTRLESYDGPDQIVEGELDIVAAE